MHQKELNKDISIAAHQSLEERDYWKNKLSGRLTRSSFPPDFPGETGDDYKIAAKEFRFSNELNSRLMKLSMDSDARLHMILVAGVLVILYRYINQQDIIVGTSIYRQEVKGDFINTELVLRNQLKKNMSFKELLLEVKDTIFAAVDHQNFPLQALLEYPGITLTESDFPLYDVVVLLENIHDKEYIQHVKPNIIFSFLRKGSAVNGVLEYNAHLYHPTTTAGIIEHFMCLMEYAVFNLDSEIAAIDLLSREEKERLVFKFNKTAEEYPRNKTIHELFQEQAARTPNRSALSYNPDLKDIFTDLRLDEPDPGLQGKYENCCFKKNPFLIPFESKVFLNILGLDNRFGENKIFLLKGQRRNFTAANRSLVRLLQLFEGNTNLKSLHQAIKKSKMKFYICHLVRCNGPEIFSRSTLEIEIDQRFETMIRLVKALYKGDFIMLTGISAKEIRVKIPLPGDEYDHSTVPQRAQCLTSSGSKGTTQRVNKKIKSPVLLLGDTTGTSTTGLLYIASFLRRNHIQAYVQWNDFNFTLDQLKTSVHRLLARIQPQLVGISMKWFPHMARALKICEWVKEFDPAIEIVVGGNTASYFTDELIRYPCIDYVISGDGEVPFFKICTGEKDIPNCSYSRGEKIVKNPIGYVHNQKNSPGIFLSHLDEIFASPGDPYFTDSVYIYTARGCSQQCIYCAGCRDVQKKSFGRKKMLLRGAKEVRKDIIAVKEYTTSLMFDSYMLFDHIMEYYQSVWQGIDLSRHYCEFYSWILPTAEFLNLLLDTFKYVYLYIDLCSLSQRHRTEISNAGFVKKQPSDKELFTFLDLCESHRNIEVKITQIAGLPYFSTEDINISTETLEKIITQYSCFRGIEWGRLHAQPGAPITRMCGTLGMYSSAVDFQDFLKYSQQNLDDPLYPDLANFSYPNIYSRDENLNQAINKFYIDTVKKLENLAESQKQPDITMDMTYIELNQQANQLATLLRSRGVGRHHIIGLIVERSLEMIAAVLGILKSGAAYLPIDPAYPPGLISYMLADSSVKILVTNVKLPGTIGFSGEIIQLDSAEMNEKPDSNPSNINRSSDLAYVIFTSGTTGRPKGILIEHRNVTAYAHTTCKLLAISPEDARVVQSSISFDQFVEEVYPILFSGARLHILNANQVQDISKLGEVFAKNGITIFGTTPGVLKEFNRFPLPHGLRAVIVGGDVLKNEYIDNIAGKIPVYNFYGPSEATVCATHFQCSGRFEEEILVGKPKENYRVYVLDQNGMLAPQAAAGELYIAGSGVGRGYQNRPGLTQEHFSDDPFIPGERIYKTGDLGRWHADGNLQFMKRMDQQVKIRGFRIEPGEIEAHIMKYQPINDCIVLDREDTAGDKYLCAYYTANESVTIDLLKEALSMNMPGHMLPSYFIQVKRIPLTPNGKVDRKALPEPHTDVRHHYTAPRDNVEEKLQAIWSGILGVEKDVIGIDNNFFELGGQSLKATSLISGIQKEFHFSMPLIEIFKAPTITEMADYIKRSNPGPTVIASDNIVLLTKGNSEANPLFLVHDGTGEVEGYVEFCRNLGQDIHCQGIKAERTGNYAPQNLTIEELSRKYLEKILQVQAQGPYAIAGWSLGGMIAFEMIGQLEQQHREIRFFAMIDTFFHRDSMFKAPGKFTVEAELKWLTEYLYITDQELPEKVKNSKQLQQLWSLVVDGLETCSGNRIKKLIPDYFSQVIPNYEQLDSQELIYYLNLARSIDLARAAYLPIRKINTPVHFFAASHSNNNYPDYWKKWNNFCMKPVTYCEIPGDHFSILKEPQVSRLASIFKTLMNPAK